MNYDRIILGLIDRVDVLEKEVNELKKNNSINKEINVELQQNPQQIPFGKDTTKYIMDGKRYGKNRLALAIVKKYMSENPNTSANELMKVFDKSLQGSLGVVRTVTDAESSYTDSGKRFFMLNQEIIQTQTVDCVVCSQWGAFNIDYLIARARELGYNVQTI